MIAWKSLGMEILKFSLEKVDRNILHTGYYFFSMKYGKYVKHNKMFLNEKRQKFVIFFCDVPF